jgi:hypothetical protein
MKIDFVVVDETMPFQNVTRYHAIDCDNAVTGDQATTCTSRIF